MTYKPGVTTPRNTRHVLASFPLYFLGGLGRNFCFSLVSHSHNPTSTTDVGYLEGQAGFRWESFAETVSAVYTRTSASTQSCSNFCLSNISFPSSSAAEVHSRVKHGVWVWIQCGGKNWLPEAFRWWWGSLIGIPTLPSASAGTVWGMVAGVVGFVMVKWEHLPLPQTPTTPNPMLSCPSGSSLQLLLILAKLVLGGWGRKVPVVLADNCSTSTSLLRSD